jgi:methionyl-tRNA formyltransferase
LRVAFAGTPEFALPALEALLAHHSVVGVLTQPDRPSGRGRKLTPSAVKTAALAHQLPLEQPQTLRGEHARAPLRTWRPELLVVVAYGLLLPEQVLTLPRYGCLNIHASLLPRWRGAAPVQRAILAGDAETGVSIMQMDRGLDTGPVLLERRLAITREHTSGTLQGELARLGAAALLEALASLDAGTALAVPQSESGATYAPKIQKSEARIEWQQDALAIERRVRAFDPWPVAQTRLQGEPLRILSARAESDSIAGLKSPKIQLKDGKIPIPGTIVAVGGDSLVVQCGTGTLAITRLQRAGRKSLGARDFSHGGDLVGRRLG